MIRLSPLAMRAAAAALALMLAAELLLPGPRGITLNKMPAIPAALPGNPANEVVGQWGNTALERPLFYPDRRPTSEPGADTSTGLPRLSAIVIIGHTRAAIFAAGGQKPRVAAIDDTIDGYRLERIEPDSVELLGPDGTLTMRPQFITAPPANQTNDTLNNNEENGN
jgi:hypothetical protein